MRETWGSNTLDFFYDAMGTPYAVKYNGTLYYYITNLQGDVLHITNSSGTTVVSYTYDPYGKPLSTTGSLASTLGADNPLRYRSYYYDIDSGLYYLQSRYYDPELCRFLNADSYASTGQGILGCNMFAYCGNNPVNSVDSTGNAAISIANILIKAAIGGLINALCAFSTGQPLQTVAYEFLKGALLGAFSELGIYFKIGVILLDAVSVVVDCYNSGVDLKMSLLAGLYSIACALVYCNGLESLAECLFDLTFGLGFSLTSAAFTEALKNKAAPHNVEASPQHSVNQGHSMIVVAENSKTRQGGKMERFSGMRLPDFDHFPGNECRIPIVSNMGWAA